MVKYMIAVLETRIHQMTYWVEAENEASARKYAEKGETDKEADHGCEEILKREILAVHES